MVSAPVGHKINGTRNPVLGLVSKNKKIDSGLKSNPVLKKPRCDSENQTWFQFNFY
jgi:hypothetical protein